MSSMLYHGQPKHCIRIQEQYRLVWRDGALGHSSTSWYWTRRHVEEEGRDTQQCPVYYWTHSDWNFCIAVSPHLRVVFAV